MMIVISPCDSDVGNPGLDRFRHEEGIYAVTTVKYVVVMTVDTTSTSSM
jgi:hypothetical protein